MDEIILEGIKVYAFHGCMKEEAMIGSDYIVNLKVKTDLKIPAKSDQLEDTVDYVDLLKIVNEEMAINSTTKAINNVQVKVAKQNPPINGNISAVSVIRNGSQ